MRGWGVLCISSSDGINVGENEEETHVSNTRYCLKSMHALAECVVSIYKLIGTKVEG